MTANHVAQRSFVLRSQDWVDVLIPADPTLPEILNHNGRWYRRDTSSQRVYNHCDENGELL